MKVRRVNDWTSRLRAAIVARDGAPFTWGTFDCCLAPCDLLEAMTEYDPAAPLRGYRTARGAAEALRRFAGKEIPRKERLDATVDRIAAKAGAVEIPPLRAQRGDLVIVPAPIANGNVENVLAIVDLTGQRVITAAYAGGWAVLPLANAVRAWRVG